MNQPTDRQPHCTFFFCFETLTLEAKPKNSTRIGTANLIADGTGYGYVNYGDLRQCVYLVR